ncbi:hypothetical protein [uncultured Barnesiella sp.]|uniref:hypothetical protein n=1 Tax=uncultured Barnesiella sp. TaxID=584861 RepID=UPI002639ECC3|nr:hypothetical protein [uncultured Barnesiella sp.]
MNPSENLVKNRNDLSPYLFHFTKGEDAYDKLTNILDQLKLTSSTHNYICFTETPITHFRENLLYMNSFYNPMLSFYGIGFRRDLLIKDFGAKSVIYGDKMDEVNLKKIDMDWRFEELNVLTHDFTWLREWRIRHEFDFSSISPEDIIIIAKTDDEVKNLCSLQELEDIDYEYEPEIGECTIWPMFSNIRGWKGISIEHVEKLASDKEVDSYSKSLKIGDYL